MTGVEYGCDRCGTYVADGDGLYHGDDRLCGECFLVDLPPVCGDCCDDPTAWAEWAATVDDLPNPADRVPCSRCGG